MDKYEYKVRADEIKELIAQGDYVQAAEIADTIDWRRVKSVMMLCIISDLYKANRRYEDAKNMLLLAYERRPGGRTICYSLCELCIKTEEFVQAVNYYKEFVQVAPKDPGRYILQYKLYEAQDVSLEERIGVLEELKKRDYREKWAYELAYLYHRVGLATRCVEECDELILWFGEGKYVIKALELKMLHAPLTPEQQQKYDGRFRSEDSFPVQEQEQNPETEEQYGEPAEEQVDTAEAPAEEDDIQVKTMDVGQYNTINLQEELAEGLKEVLGNRQDKSAEVTRAIMEPMYNSDTESLDFPEIGEVDAEDLEPEKEQVESSEVFFGETGDLSSLYGTENGGEPALKELTAPEPDSTEAESSSQQAAVPTGEENREEEKPVQEKAEDTTAEAVMEEMRSESQENIQPPEPLARVLSQESDGQIRLVVPESESIEKQITGQMSIEDILTEWERMKRENEQKRKEEVRQHVLQQTGAMFTEFEAAVRDGLLEKLEKDAAAKNQKPAEAVVPDSEDTDDLEAEVEEIAFEAEEAEDLSDVAEQEAAGEEAGADGAEIVEDGEFEELEEVEEPVLEEEPFEEDAAVEEIEEIPGVEYTEEVSEPEETPEAYAVQEEAVERAEEYTEQEMPEEAAVGEASEEYAGQEVSEEAVDGDAPEEYAGQEMPEEMADGEVSEEYTGQEMPEKAEGGEAPEEYAESEMSVEEADGEASEGYAESEISGEVTDEEASEEYAEQEMPAEEYSEEYPEGDETAEEIAGGEPSEPVRERAKVRSLTKEEKELYGPFIQSRSAKEKLVQTIDNISMAAYTGNVIITGEEGMDTVTLAKNMIREVQMTDSNFSGKVAKISGAGLDKKNPEQTLNQLKNGALIIQKASGMSSQTADAVYKVLQQDNIGIILVLEDTKRAMNRFLKENPKLAECFTARMDVEALSNDTLVAFGRQYAREMEYSIDELGVLALHTRIAGMQTLSHAVTVVDVKQIVDEAIWHANRKTLKHFFDILFARRYDEEDMIILTEKDFI